MPLPPAGTDTFPADSPASALPSPDVAPLIPDPDDLSALFALGDDPDAVFARFAEWAEAGGTPLYPAQEEALIELVSGANVVLATPTGSGKSLVATGAQFAALAADQV